MSFDIDVSRTLGDRIIGLRCRIDTGVVALLGPSGVGKTSMLNMVAGLLRPDCGHVRVGADTLFDQAGGIDLPVAQRRAGYVFQDRRLFPHMRVRGNLLYGHRPDAAMTLDEVVTFLGIAPLLDRWPRNLSGGEAQRVAIGRALLSGPRFLLFDEPLSSVDPARKTGILDVIDQIHCRTAIPILYVTHDVAEAERLSAHVVTVDNADRTPALAR